MKHKPQNRELERFSYWEGQMLRASDFLDIQRVEEQKRWWHNRALHSAFGVYRGFDATQTAATKRSIGGIELTPGVAYDSFGRELILECAADVEIPNGPVAKGKKRFLIVRYKKPGSRQMTDPLAAVCCVAGGPTSAGNVEFVWLDAPQFTTGGGVPLGHLTYLDRAVPKFVAFVATQKVRPLARPRIGTGSTIPGNTSWQPWTFDMPLLRGIVFSAELGVQTTVDTSAAGFTEIPQYFAWIEGSIWNAQTMQLVPAILPSIDNEALDSFTFRLILMPQPVAPQLLELAPPPPPATQLNLIQNSADFSFFATQQGLYVFWIGCQMPYGLSTRPIPEICRKHFQTTVEQVCD